jgi:uncharacterized protein (DUF58 family)
MERSLSSATVREHAPGDPYRWIHWPTTARQGTLHVRLFDGAPVGVWWIILDVERSVQVGAGLQGTEEHGVILAASLAARAIHLGRSVGMIAAGVSPVWLPPRADASQQSHILRALALLEPGDLPLDKLLSRASPALGRNASVIVITADTGGVWLHRLLPLRRRGIIPTVLLLDPHSFGAVGAEASATATAALLGELGIAHHIITKEFIADGDQLAGKQGNWEWRVLRTGRVIATRKPSDLSWRQLG